MVTLKDETSYLHRVAEQMPFNKRMMNGELTDEEYGSYLKVLQGIYGTIESQSDPLHPELPRFDAVKRDLSELDLDEIPWTGKWATRYMEHLTMLNEQDLQAHMYLHYLAIVFGGQMIKKNVPGSGTLYDFENTKEIVGSIREKQAKFDKEWIPEVSLGFVYMIKIFEELDNG